MGLFFGWVQCSGSFIECFINYFFVGIDFFEMLGNLQFLLEVNYQVDLIFEWCMEVMAFKVDVFVGYLQDYIFFVIDFMFFFWLFMSLGVW